MSASDAQPPRHRRYRTSRSTVRTVTCAALAIEARPSSAGSLPGSPMSPISSSDGSRPAVSSGRQISHRPKKNAAASQADSASSASIGPTGPSAPNSPAAHRRQRRIIANFAMKAFILLTVPRCASGIRTASAIWFSRSTPPRNRSIASGVNWSVSFPSRASKASASIRSSRSTTRPHASARSESWTSSGQLGRVESPVPAIMKRSQKPSSPRVLYAVLRRSGVRHPRRPTCGATMAFEGPRSVARH